MKLCFVDGNIAYFTSQELSHQRGDDWDNAPYEHNAGLPHEPFLLRDYENGTPRWDIIKVRFLGSFQRPNSGHYNSPYSVEMINSGSVPWLITSNKVNIMAGIELSKFIDIVDVACPRCGQKSYNDFGEDCRLNAEVNGDIISLRFMCDDCAIWSWNRLEKLLNKNSKRKISKRNE